MTTNANSNIAVLLKVKSGETYATFGEVVSFDPPEILHEEIEATNQNSEGWKEYIPSGLKELAEFKVTINYTTTTSTLVTEVTDGTIKDYQVAFPNTQTWSFKAFAKAFKPNSVDEQKPDVLQAEITFRPTGKPTFA